MFALAVALTLGAIAATTADFISWRMAAPSPTTAEATTLTRTALPDVPAPEVGWHDDVHDVHFMKQPGSESAPGQQQVNIDGNVSWEAFDQARTRLAAAGWRITSGPNAFFVASRDDFVMEWEYGVSSAGGVEVWIWRFTPLRVKVLTVAGWLLGGLAGWWLARRVWALADGPARTWLTRLLVTGTVLLGLSTLATAYWTIHGLLDLPVRNGQPVAFWIAYFPFLLPFGFHLG